MLTDGMVAYNLAQNLWLPQDQLVGESVLTFFLETVGPPHFITMEVHFDVREIAIDVAPTK